MPAIMLVGATAIEAVTIARGMPTSRPMTAPEPRATHISSLVKPRNTAGSRLSRSGRKTKVPSARRSIVSFMPTSQNRGSFGEEPDDDHYQQGADTNYRAKVFPGLALVLDIGEYGQGEEHQNQQGEQYARSTAAKGTKAHASCRPAPVSRPHHPGTPQQSQDENQGQPQFRAALCREAGSVLKAAVWASVMLTARTLRMGCRDGILRPTQWSRGVERERGRDSPAHPGGCAGCLELGGDSQSGNVYLTLTELLLMLARSKAVAVKCDHSEHENTNRKNGHCGGPDVGLELRSPREEFVLTSRVERAIIKQSQHNPDALPIGSGPMADALADLNNFNKKGLC
ncbi:hypothetical protein L1887_58326 [Cichorium endivia]|nr:hypothetical protein L1887_58326 [Cichorium endivia]